MDKYLKRKKIFVTPKPPPQPPQQSESPPPTKEEMTTSAKKPKQEELEVTGVSRSGRVRKKSSKLTDFESPDEIDPRYKRKADRTSAAQDGNEQPAVTPTTHKQKKATPAARKAPAPPPPQSPVRSMEESEEEDEEEEEEESYTHGMKGEPEFDSDSEAAMMFSHTEEVGEEEEASSDESAEEGGTANSEDEDEDLDDDDEGQLVMVDDGPKPSRPTNQAMSLYMLEKSTKKRLVVKDGKIIGRKKAQRKDKGKSRFTAYMLWAKEARKEILRSNPDMDFSTTSKRLGELWSIVPNNEKFLWRRRAKRLSVKQKADENKAAASNSASGRKFINKSPPAPKLASPPRQEWKRQEKRASNQQQGQLGTLAAAAAVAQQQQQMQLMQQQQLQTALAVVATDVKTGGIKTASSLAEAQAAGMFKAVGTAPVDVASHLKLLGESLLIIGERLKEHEGQIAVSGSFSVLLDSLLCAMAPLLCLTQQVPELNGCPADILSQTLDNIAYIMPGL